VISIRCVLLCCGPKFTRERDTQQWLISLLRHKDASDREVNHESEERDNYTTEFSMTPANEEAHWSSFRRAIAGLQFTLTGLGNNTNNSNYASSYQHDPSSLPQDMSAFQSGDGAKSHQHLELIGLEEDTTSVYNRRNNSQGDNEHEQHAQSSAHSSHATMDALSITAQQLSETRLKLALIESERDELEFQLMQKS